VWVVDVTPDPLTQRVLDLLGASPLAWSTVSGTLHGLYEEAVTHPEAVERNTTDGPEFGRLEGTYRFWATASPWQLRLETVRQIVPRGRDDAMMPDVLITDRWTWRARRGRHLSGGRWQPDQIITDRERKRWVVYDGEVRPDPGYTYSSHGLENLDLLLKPAPLLRAFHFADATPIEHDGRTGIQVQAVPRERDEFHWWAGGLVVIGADSYVFTVDATRGIVLDVTISIARQVGRRHTVSDLHFDAAIDQELFSQSALESELG
jgi:hypothetical protein